MIAITSTDLMKIRRHFNSYVDVGVFLAGVMLVMCLGERHALIAVFLIRHFVRGRLPLLYATQCRVPTRLHVLGTVRRHLVHDS
jgi:hypothetical protein